MLNQKTMFVKKLIVLSSRSTLLKLKNLKNYLEYILRVQLQNFHVVLIQSSLTKYYLNIIINTKACLK